MLATFLSFFGKFVVNIFSNVINEQLSTPGETINVKRYEGKIHAPHATATKLAAKYARLRRRDDRD